MTPYPISQMRLARYPDAQTLLQVVPQNTQVMNTVMTVTIHLMAIMMVGIVVHLIQLQIGINIVKHVNVIRQQLQQPLQPPLLQVVLQNTQVMIIVMTVTIHVKAILMVGIAVHLMQLQIGIYFVTNVHALSLRFQVRAFEFIFFSSGDKT